MWGEAMRQPELNGLGEEQTYMVGGRPAHTCYFLKCLTQKINN